MQQTPMQVWLSYASFEATPASMLGEDEQEGEGGEAERRQAAAEQEGLAAAADREAHARRSARHTSCASHPAYNSQTSSASQPAYNSQTSSASQPAYNSRTSYFRNCVHSQRLQVHVYDMCVVAADSAPQPKLSGVG